MKKKIITLMTVGCLLSGLAHAIDESGGTRGGEVIKKDGQWVLRDRIDDTTYRCYTGKNAIEQDQSVVGELNVMTKALNQVNWYLARAYRNEIANVYFCFGKSDLVKIETEDRDSLTAYYFSERNESKMVAIRIDNAIRVVRDLFDGLSANDKARLIIHELTHSFIKRSHRSYNDSVRSFANAVATNAIDLWNPEDFAIQMREGGIEISSNYAVLNLYRNDIEKVLDTNASLSDRIKSLKSAKKVMPELMAADRVIYLDLLQNANDFLKTAIKTDDVEAVRELIKMGANPAAVAGLDIAYQAKSFKVFTLLVGSSSRSIGQQMLKSILADEDGRFLEALFVGGYDFSKKDQVIELAVEVCNRERLDYIIHSPQMDDIYYLEEIFNIVRPIFDPTNKDEQAAFLAMTNLLNGSTFNIDEIYNYALKKGYGQVIQTIIDSVDVNYINMQNEQENTALDIAIKSGDMKLFTYLVTNSMIDLGRTKFYGNSYLHTAVIYEQFAMVEYLLENKLIDINVKNNAGKTPYQVAKDSKNKPMKKLLKKYRK